MADWIPGLNVGHAFNQIGANFGSAWLGAPRRDYDVVDNMSVAGGARSPSSGAPIGAQGPVAPGWVDDGRGGLVQQQGQVAASGASSTQAGGGGSVGGGGYAAPVDTSVVDSTGRRWASQAALNANVNNVRRNVGVKQGGFEGSERSTAQGNRQAYNNDAQDFVTGIKQGQNTINSGRVNNALNLRRSMAGIASGLRQGIRSGAVNLANMNAIDSGAADAMARAFARQGNSQAADVNNEAQLKENEFATTQNNLGLQREQGLGRLKGWRENKVNEISSRLWQNLAELDATASGEGVNGAVDMGIRDRVVSDASRMLDEVDQITQAELAKIGGLDYGQVQEQASQMDAAGALASNPFSVEAGTMQWGNGQGGVGSGAGTGAPLGPIGTGARYRDEQGNLMPLVAPAREEETVRV